MDERIGDIVPQNYDGPADGLPNMEYLARNLNNLRKNLRPVEPRIIDFEISIENSPTGFLNADFKKHQQRHVISATDLMLKLLADAKEWFVDVRRVYIVASYPESLWENSITVGKQIWVTMAGNTLEILVSSTIFINLIVAQHIDFAAERESHKFKELQNTDLTAISQMSNMTVFQDILRPMLIERVADSDGSMLTQRHIKYWMEEELKWHIEEVGFQDFTPYHIKYFRNIIATLDPSAKRFLTLACHFDSKYFRDFVFIGATDSAVPCAMLIDLARTLNHSLHHAKDSYADGVSLQFLFFDGEEAFVHWTDTDSTYGSRYLAKKWHSMPHPHDPNHNVLDGMDALVLLDLIGVKNPKFRNYFSSTDRLYGQLKKIETDLQALHLSEEYEGKSRYFTDPRYNGIEDDHIPFLKRGVPILHLIPYPFPAVWHKATDNESALHYPTINNLNKIFRIFVSKYLHLSI